MTAFSGDILQCGGVACAAGGWLTFPVIRSL
jgi:hypothetical protein